MQRKSRGFVLIPPVVRPAFAKRLHEAMVDAGITRERAHMVGPDIYQLAEFLGVTRQMATRYLEGVSLPDPEKMAQIADWLGVRLGWLRDGEGTRTDATRDDHVATEDERKLLALYRRCSPEQRSHIMQYISVVGSSIK